DWEFLFAAGLGVVAERDGAIVGTTLAWLYGEDAAALGMVIVSADCRGGGVGRKLMDAMLERLDGRTVQLNATDVALPLYKTLGFVSTGGIHQHQGTPSSVPIVSLREGERVRPMGKGDLAAIAELDHKATGFQRRDLLARVLKGAQGVVLDRDGEAVGFTIFRRFGMGYAIGPAVAPDAQGAKALISHWLGSNAGMFSRLDLPHDSGLGAWLGDLGLPEVGRVTTMVRGPAPARDTSAATFAILSQALG
ncbi:MAG TPA: GNAT family N-acetyltransferase, partial [Phenylobacterium sp.]|nr:GNAT family N-acetyltransferase [Phenylobacterium sp.]